MPPTPSDPTLGPPRPSPPRSPAEAVGAWVAWFGTTRLVLTAVSVLVVGAGAYWLLRAPAPDTVALLPAADATAPIASTLPPPSTSADQPMVVHVAGAVARPGVVTVPPGARVHDAIAAAGGAVSDAEIDAVNLATPLVDGQRVYVPAAGEVSSQELAASAGTADAPGPTTPPGPLDLNQATIAELEQLPGIGPATASAIVDDRARNGPFVTVDELERVPGIGPAKLAALRDLLTT